MWGHAAIVDFVHQNLQMASIHALRSQVHVNKAANQAFAKVQSKLHLQILSEDDINEIHNKGTIN